MPQAASRLRLYRERPSIPIPVWNGLIEHRREMGPAIWEFLWLLDKITVEKSDDDGRKVGLVLGGKPILVSQLATDLRLDERTVRKNLGRLERHGYISRKRTPRGKTIRVLNSAKWDIWKSKRAGENTRSRHVSDRNFFPGDRAIRTARAGENARCRSDSAVDSTGDTTKTSAASRPVLPSRVLTEQQKRYGATARLIREVETLLVQDATEGRPRSFADLKEDVKRLAAKKGFRYDGDMVTNAIDIAERRLRADQSGPPQTTPVRAPQPVDSAKAATRVSEPPQALVSGGQP